MLKYALLPVVLILLYKWISLKEPVNMSGSIKLTSGYNFPNFGLGTWQSKPGEVAKSVIAAVEAGYRHIDGAWAYGNEAEIGGALKQLFDAGTVKREDLFITSKLWNTKHHAEDIKPILQESLNSLGLKFLDLYLIHWPIAFKAGKETFPKDANGKLIYDNIDPLDTWKVLESCVDEGLVRSIGLSNFNSQQIQRIIDNSRIKPAVVQVEVNLYMQQHKLASFCHERGIAVTGFSCLGSPARPWAKDSDPSQLEDPKLREIAGRVGKSPAQVILRWLVQRNIVPIPKSVTPSRIVENFKIWDFTLSTEDMEALNKLDRNFRSVVPRAEGSAEYRDKDAPHFPFLIEF